MVSSHTNIYGVGRNLCHSIGSSHLAWNISFTEMWFPCCQCSIRRVFLQHTPMQPVITLKLMEEFYNSYLPELKNCLKWANISVFGFLVLSSLVVTYQYIVNLVRFCQLLSLQFSTSRNEWRWVNLKYLDNYSESAFTKPAVVASWHICSTSIYITNQKLAQVQQCLCVSDWSVWPGSYLIKCWVVYTAPRRRYRGLVKYSVK